MKKAVKIGIMGEFRSGKDTVADYLKDAYGMVQFAFATELKNGFHKEYPHISAIPKPREGYQIYGDLKRYAHGKDYFIDITLEEIDHIGRLGVAFDYVNEENPYRPVITDVRFPNERIRLEMEDYIIIKVVTPERIKLERAQAAGDNFSPESMQHDSEKFIRDAPADYTIYNDGTLEELYDAIDTVMLSILGKEGL